VREKSTAIVLTTVAVLLFSGATARAQTFTTLYNFTGGSDGGYPFAGVIQDNAGNVYGTTYYGGANDYGVVFEVNTGTETVLHSFTGGATDGAYPYAALVRSRDGDLYGTASEGGTNGMGVVFKVDTAGNETVLYSFGGGTVDGCYPYGGLLMDRSGSLYGTTNLCGASNRGTVFKLSKTGKETLLHSFAGGSKDGAYPYFGRLTIDTKGNLYGVTDGGGGSGKGALYTLTRTAKLTLLHSFAGGSRDGCNPFGTVALDKQRNVYGTTDSCGSAAQGTVWRVSEKRKETILYNFTGGSDGCYTVSGVVLDSTGSLYGNALGCGAYYYFGTVWKLSKGTLTVLHSFDQKDGQEPVGDLLRDATGALYGTTSAYGGSGNYGTVWSYK